MGVDDAAVLARPHSAEDLDDVFEVLAHRYRRAIVGELEWGKPATLDELVAVVADDDAVSATDVRVALAHNHLPKLASTGVITYDADEQVAELDDAVAERAVLAAVRQTD